MVVETDADDDGLLDVFYRDAWRRFEMDKVFGPSSSQKQVCTRCKDVIVLETVGIYMCNEYACVLRQPNESYLYVYTCTFHLYIVIVIYLQKCNSCNIQVSD